MLARIKGFERWGFRWAGFDKPRWMLRRDDSDHDMGSAFLYGVDRQRIVHYEMTGIDRSLEPAGVDDSAYWRPGNLRKKKLYVGGSLELDYVKSGGSWEMDAIRVYIPSPSGKAGAAELDPTATSAADHRFYVYHYDHLGSVQVITDWGQNSQDFNWLASNDKAGREAVYSYDAWGARRDAGDWSSSVYTQSPNPETFTYAGDDDITPRGFTGHEMLDDLGLVHMNGRIYDPMLGRFLSADVVIPDPHNLQDYNRYSYVRNNPLSLSDPTGFIPANMVETYINGVEIRPNRAQILNNFAIVPTAGDTYEMPNLQMGYGGINEVQPPIQAQGGQSGGAGSSSSGSRLGNALRNIPIAGFVLGSVGDIVSGQIGHGVSSFVNTLTADIGATAVGVFGKVYVTGRDLYRMGGSLLSGDLKGFGGNFAKFAHDLIIPTYGWYGGAGWGAEQDGIWGLRNPFNAVDANSQIHDGSNGNHLGWVVNNWRELGTVGPVASAYTILGTIPFTAGDFITDDGKP